MCVYTHTCHTCGVQRTTGLSQFSPSTMWIPEIEVQLGNRYPYPLSHLTDIMIVCTVSETQGWTGHTEGAQKPQVAQNVIPDRKI